MGGRRYSDGAAPMAALREKVRAFVKETVGYLLVNQRPN